jgi:hypothetical protein
MPGFDIRSTTRPEPSLDDLTTRTVRELIVELSLTEDSLREWRAGSGRRDVPVLDVHTLLARQRDLVAELRARTDAVDLTSFDAAPGPAVHDVAS